MGIDAEFVVAASQVLYERMAAYDDIRGAYRFDSAHWS